MDIEEERLNEIQNENEVTDEILVENEQQQLDENEEASIEIGKIVIPGNDIMKQINNATKQDGSFEGEYSNKEVSEGNINENSDNIRSNGSINSRSSIQSNNNNKASSRRSSQSNNNISSSRRSSQSNNTNNSRRSSQSNNNISSSRRSSQSNNANNSRRSSQSNSTKTKEEEKEESKAKVLKNKKEFGIPKDDSLEKNTSIFNYTSIYSDIMIKNNSIENTINSIQQHIEEKKREQAIEEEKENTSKNKEKSSTSNINLINLTKENFLDILNHLDYDDIVNLKSRLSEIGIYNQFNDVLFEKQNKIIESLIEQKQDMERKIRFQKEEIVRLRCSVENYDEKLKYAEKKILNDICNRCGISFDKFGYPHRITVFGRALSKEEIVEKTKIQSDLIENGLLSRMQVPNDDKPKSLE